MMTPSPAITISSKQASRRCSSEVGATAGRLTAQVASAIIFLDSHRPELIETQVLADVEQDTPSAA